ncbi:MAG: hypothetical protein WBD20_24035 [Pirellulaceae bacterium]
MKQPAKGELMTDDVEQLKKENAELRKELNALKGNGKKNLIGHGQSTMQWSVDANEREFRNKVMLALSGNAYVTDSEGEEHSGQVELSIYLGESETVRLIAALAGACRDVYK